MRAGIAGLLMWVSWLQAGNAAGDAARAWRQAHEREILTEFIELLSLPNLATDTPNIRRNAAAVSAVLEHRGVHTRLLEVEGAPPAVYGERLTPGAARTLVFYAHYDGQPLEPKEWTSAPWTPVLRDSVASDSRPVTVPPTGPINPEWRVYARSSADDKAPIIAFAAALDAIRAAGVPLHSNIKFLLEGEEEAGSAHLPAIIARNKDLLGSDVWLICDGPLHQSRQRQIVFGARGIATVEITVYGARRELHSGHYGNWAPNPAMMLSRLLASMKDDDGRVLIRGFYDGIEPLSETEKRAIAEAPPVDEDLERELWLGSTQGEGRTWVDLLNEPSLNVRGMASARVGAQVSNVVPSRATASIDMRLVKGISPEQAVARLLEHIRAQGYFVVDHDPDAQTRMQHAKVAKVTAGEFGYRAVRTSMDLPISRLVLETAGSLGSPVVKLPTMGGSVPLFAIEDILHTPTITVPIANHDNNQHAANENLRVQNLWDGIELMAALLDM
jgi:acetylornithine deacetylase/succinyl-diaminopimelate desuccinylase-like protein